MKYLKELLIYIKFKLNKLLNNEKNIIKVLNNNIDKITCIDLGASYYPHKKWDFFIDSNKTNWVAVDPNEKNLKYIDNWKFKSTIIKMPKSISADGGFKDLYITNIDSGSSLLIPKLNSNSEHRESYDYYFPYKKVKIETISINELLNTYNQTNILMKLDIQGIEGDVLTSINEKNLEKIILIETEQNFNLTPTMQGTTKFYDLQKFLEDNNFEILEIETVNYSRSKSNKRGNKNIICESNIIFARSHDYVLSKGIKECFSLMGGYLSYKYYGEIFGLCEKILKHQEFKVYHPEIKKILKELK
jgi:FkbM family methyltransferase